MSAQDHNHQTVRLIVLPSGKTVEVVFFAPEAQLAREFHAAEDLHVCGECSSPLVYPTDWHAVGETEWSVCRRCPECEWRGVGTFSQDAVDRFDEELNRAADALALDLRRLSRMNMRAEVELFISALNAGGILPHDF